MSSGLRRILKTNLILNLSFSSTFIHSWDVIFLSFYLSLKTFYICTIYIRISRQFNINGHYWILLCFCLILDNLFLKELFKHWKHVETFYIDLKFSMQLRTYSLCNILVSGGQNCLHSMLRDTFMSGSYLSDPILLRTWLIDFWQVLLVYW